MFAALLMRGCDKEAETDITSAIIEYSATTRGFYRHVIASDGTIKVSKERNDKEVPTTHKLSRAQTKAIVQAFNEINLEEMETLKAPSEKRFYDGAAIANLKITYKGKTYASQAFDHKNPPAEIERLVNIMAEYTTDNE